MSSADITAFEMVIRRLETMATVYEAKYNITPDPTTLPDAVEARVLASGSRTGTANVVSFGQSLAVIHARAHARAHARTATARSSLYSMRYSLATDRIQFKK